MQPRPYTEAHAPPSNVRPSSGRLTGDFHFGGGGGGKGAVRTIYDPIKCNLEHRV